VHVVHFYEENKLHGALGGAFHYEERCDEAIPAIYGPAGRSSRRFAPRDDIFIRDGSAGALMPGGGRIHAVLEAGGVETCYDAGR